MYFIGYPRADLNTILLKGEGFPLCARGQRRENSSGEMESGQVKVGQITSGQNVPVAPLSRLLLIDRWLLVRDTLEFGFDVYRNLKQADVQNKLGELLGKAIKGAGV